MASSRGVLRAAGHRKSQHAYINYPAKLIQFWTELKSPHVRAETKAYKSMGYAKEIEYAYATDGKNLTAGIARQVQFGTYITRQARFRPAPLGLQDPL